MKLKLFAFFVLSLLSITTSSLAITHFLNNRQTLTATVLPSPSPIPTSPPPTIPPVAIKTPKANPVSASLTTNRTVVTPQPVNSDTRCLITISGNQYDVTQFRTQHSGGDIFQCGTDMTAAYVRQHGTDLSRLKPFLVANSNSTNPMPTSSIVQTINNEHDRDDD